MTAQAYSGNDNVSIRNICPWGEALASSFLPNGEIALAVTSTTAFHLIVSGGALGYSPAMSEALRFANFVTEADHMLLDQQRRKSKLDSQEAARTKTVELLKAQMSQAQTKREQNSVWTAFGEHQERELNELIAEELESLKTILLSGLSQRHAIDFNELRERRNASVVDSSVGPAPSRQLFEASVPPLSFFRRLFPSQRQKHEAKLKAAIAEYKREHREYQNRLTTARNNFEAAKAARNAAIDEFEKAYQDGQADAVACYCALALKRSVYPESIPRSFRTVFVSESSELVVDALLPTIRVIPEVESVSWVKSKHEFKEKRRKDSELHKLYQELIAGIALRHMHEVFTSDVAAKVTVLVFNGYVDTLDRATGKEIRPYLISTRTTRGQFEELNLARVELLPCLRNLGAQVSNKPGELLPVKPIVEFDMVDKRFVGEMDVISELDERPNLMDLTPHAFEGLVSNLFAKMGLETKLTRSTRDGGVDVVAFDRRPVLGGRVVIQAKRYSHTVGVAAVRDLFGTMINEGANKGILVTTSGYGPDAFEFANDKPIELISGSGLLYLLDQAGHRARIMFPQEASASA